MSGPRDQLDVQDLIGRLTLEEKASLCSGSDFWHTQPVERLGVPALTLSDGPHGLRMQPDEARPRRAVPGACPPPASPPPSALGSSWDVELLRPGGGRAGRPRPAPRACTSCSAPGINIKRSPLCGRNFEYLSEDPFLAGELGAAMVHGAAEPGRRRRR